MNTYLTKITTSYAYIFSFGLVLFSFYSFAVVKDLNANVFCLALGLYLLAMMRLGKKKTLFNVIGIFSFIFSLISLAGFMPFEGNELPGTFAAIGLVFLFILFMVMSFLCLNRGSSISM